MVWGPQWSFHRVLFQCDNEAVVAVINSGTSHDDDVMHLLHCLFNVAKQFNFVIRAVHIPGVQNVLADALSHFKLQVFHQARQSHQSRARCHSMGHTGEVGQARVVTHMWQYMYAGLAL